MQDATLAERIERLEEMVIKNMLTKQDLENLTNEVRHNGAEVGYMREEVGHLRQDVREMRGRQWQGFLALFAAMLTIVVAIAINIIVALI